LDFLNSGSDWVLVAAPSPCWRESSKLYFEVEVCEAVGEVLVGFAGANFQADGIGLDDKSWAIYNSGEAVHR
jgi:hypothetical protein